MALTAGHLEALLKQADRYAAGQELVVQGQASKDLLLLVSGRVQFVRDGEVVGHEFEPGTFMGVLACFADSPRAATIRAETDVHVLLIPPRRIPALLEGTPALGVRLLETIADLFSDEAKRRTAEQADHEKALERIRGVIDVFFPLLALVTVGDSGKATQAAVLEQFGRALEALGLLTTHLVVGRDALPRALATPEVAAQVERAKERARQTRTSPESDPASRRLAERLDLVF